MLIELYIFFEIVMLAFFCISFYTKHEILWAITSVLSGTLAFTSWNIEYYVYQYNVTLGAYYPVFTNNSYGYLMALNLLFFVLALVLAIHDLFDKYGDEFSRFKEKFKN